MRGRVRTVRAREGLIASLGSSIRARRPHRGVSSGDQMPRAMQNPRMTFARSILVTAALTGAAAVLLGAFGAHALRDSLDERALATWHTAVDYQFWHALALLAIGLLMRKATSVALRIASLALCAGIVLFCGSLYLLALGAPRGFGTVTPIGGAALIAGWLALAWHAWRDLDD